MSRDRFFYSCVVDATPVFYWQAWGWIHSLLHLCAVPPAQVFVHHTDDADAYFLEEVRKTGVHLRLIERFGDGKFCNKVAQLRTPEFQQADWVCLMDTDMIVLKELSEMAQAGAISGKRVDLPNPDIETLKQLFSLAGFQSFPAEVPADCSTDLTFQGNFNGGLYIVPGDMVTILGRSWEKWVTWLMDHIDVLERIRKQNHVDQIAFCMAVHEHSIPLRELDRLFNFPVQLNIEKVGTPTVLHYHRKLTKHGLIDGGEIENVEFKQAIQMANALLGKYFNNKIFWSFRYAVFPELGSGVGSRNQNLLYKRELLEQLWIEKCESVLDVGCGDLEIIRAIPLRNYTGIDPSPEAIETARLKRPDLKFILISGLEDQSIPSADTVICFEVLIHQKTLAEYHELINLISLKTERRLIVSGYSNKQPHHESNHMIQFHEALHDSLKNTGRFSKISKIGAHSDVEIFLAEV